ncbi:MAG: hypothetical protein GX887_05195 [Firmicutes bacterium]|nr:hypothetical protein [Bacillota bacterium]
MKNSACRKKDEKGIGGTIKKSFMEKLFCRMGGLVKVKVAAFSLADLPINEPEDYRAALTALFRKLEIRLAVLPAHTSLLLCTAAGYPDEKKDFSDRFNLFMKKSTGWNKEYLQLHGRLAKDNKLYLVAGTTVEEESGHLYHTSYLFGPDGEIRGRQQQTHLSREERALGLSRGRDLHLFECDGLKIGLLPCTDARHPEVGRIFALKGADLLVHCGALYSKHVEPVQPAGMWAQVQQNQFWAVEAQLNKCIGNRSFNARCAVIGPCEVTHGSTGYLDRETVEKPYAAAELNEADRRKIKDDYPLLELLHPDAYEGLLPELYR